MLAPHWGGGQGDKVVGSLSWVKLTEESINLE